MISSDNDSAKGHSGGGNGSPSDAASTLLPMLVGGLALTIVALIVVVIFV